MSDGPIITIKLEWPRWVQPTMETITRALVRLAGMEETNAEREGEVGARAEGPLHAAGHGSDQASDEDTAGRRSGDHSGHEGHAETERCAECGGSGWTGHVPRRRCLACTKRESEESTVGQRTPQPSPAVDTLQRNTNPTDKAPGDITRDEPNPSPGAESLPRYVVIGPRSNGRVWGAYGAAYSQAQSLGAGHLVELYDPDVANEYTEGKAGR